MALRQYKWVARHARAVSLRDAALKQLDIRIRNLETLHRDAITEHRTDPKGYPENRMALHQFANFKMPPYAAVMFSKEFVNKVQEIADATFAVATSVIATAEHRKDEEGYRRDSLFAWKRALGGWEEVAVMEKVRDIPRGAIRYASKESKARFAHRPPRGV